MATEPPPVVTVIVPVWNQQVALDRCLRALAEQVSPYVYEVVVVDNGSVPPIHAPAPCRILRLATPGSYAARNAGIQIARGPILAFTDADCQPTPTWLARGVIALQQLPGPGLVGGRVLPVGATTTLASGYDEAVGFRQDRFILEWGFAATANLFTTRKTIDQVGDFDPSLYSLGDLDWGLRVCAQGLTVAYAPTVCVAHQIRTTLRAIVRKVRRTAGGYQQLVDRRGQRFDWRVRRRRVLPTPRTTWWRVLQWQGLVWGLELIRWAERLRVHLGGTPCRS